MMNSAEMLRYPECYSARHRPKANTLTNKSSLTTRSPLERDKSEYGVTDLNVFRQTAIRALD